MSKHQKMKLNSLLHYQIKKKKRKNVQVDPLVYECSNPRSSRINCVYYVHIKYLYFDFQRTKIKNAI